MVKGRKGNGKTLHAFGMIIGETGELADDSRTGQMFGKLWEWGLFDLWGPSTGPYPASYLAYSGDIC
jgi:hypothetical protein